jgi:hydrogenase maturation protease
MKSSLIIGYGNPDREDDGLAWHVLTKLAGRFGQPILLDYELDFVDNHQSPDFQFLLQLTPEITELIKNYQRVCFVDAHTGNIPDKLKMTPLVSEFQASPFTHHLTPASCMALCSSLFQVEPEAVLVTVRGYRFGFTQTLSTQTMELVDVAVDEIEAWLVPPY